MYVLWKKILKVNTSASDVHVRARLYHGGLYEPRKTEAHQDVEDVAAHSVTDCHVAKTLLDDRQRGKRVWHAHASGNESQSHHGVGNAQSTACKIETT